VKFSLDIAGDKETARALAEMKRQAMPELESELRASGQPLKSVLQQYAAPRPGSDYVRTYNYRQSIDVNVQLRGSVVELTQTASKTEYWVRGTADGSYGGAWMHKGRWRSKASIMRDFVPLVIRRLQNRLYALAQRVGLRG
jgi:hypothetical protein